MRMQERELAREMGVRDPQGAIDRWYARQRVQLSFLSDNVLRFAKAQNAPWPKRQHDVEMEGLRGPSAQPALSPDVIIGEIGIVGTSPVTYRGQLVMWSFKRGGYVLIPEPAPVKRPWWRRLMGLHA